MKNHYGELDGTVGYDGDPIDVFIGDNPNSGQVFVIDQVNPETGAFDESKAMLGFDTAEQAKQAYLGNYDKDWQGFGAITPAGDNFKAWLYDGAKQRKPFAAYKDTPEAVESVKPKIDINPKLSAQPYAGQDLRQINERFNSELQQQIDGTLAQEHVYRLGMPGWKLLNAGIDDSPIEITAQRLKDKSAQADHPFDLSELKDLATAIQNPIAVFDSATQKGSYVVLTEIEHNGKNFVVAIDANKKKGSIEINDIRSIHYRSNNIHIANWINSGLLKWVDKEKASEWHSKQRYNSAEVKGAFKRSANIIHKFENGTGKERFNTSERQQSPTDLSLIRRVIAQLRKKGLARNIIIDLQAMRDYLMENGFEDVRQLAYWLNNSRQRDRWDNSGYTEREDGTKVSVRALEAESKGTFTSGQFRKVYGVSKPDFDILVSLGIIRQTEWHHTGKSFKESDFYSWSDSIRAGGEVDYTHENGGWQSEETENSLAQKYADNKKEISKLSKEFATKEVVTIYGLV